MKKSSDRSSGQVFRPQPMGQCLRLKRFKRLERFQSFKTFNPFNDQRGVALVLVLWIFIFLFVVAFDFTASVREEGMAAHRYAEEAEGYYLALAGFEQALYGFLNPRQLGVTQRADLIDGEWREGGLGDGLYRVRLIDEGGKINLNRATEEALRRVFTNLEIEEPRRTILVDSILDWRDEDNLHRVNGAESDYYLSLSPPYTAKNGPFDAVEELLWVRGVTPELFYGLEEDGVRRVGLKEIFTVDGPLDRVNLRTASAEVIHALLGVPLEQSRAFVEERKNLSDKTFEDLLKLLGITAAEEMQRYFVLVAPSVITIEAAGYHAESASPTRLKGVVRMVGGNQGFQLVRWVDRDVGISERKEE